MKPTRRTVLGLAASTAIVPAATGDLLYAADFSRPARIAREEDFIAQSSDGTWRRTAKPDPHAEWIAEGSGGVEVRDSRLHVVSNGSHMVVWNSMIFPQSFLLDFRMSPDGSSSGLAIVFFCATGSKGEDLFDLALPPRRADYPAYHSGAIANYSDSYWSRNTAVEAATNRLRRNPGFNLVAEGPSRTLGSTSVWHRIQILKSGNRVQTTINGTAVHTWNDPAVPLGAGRIGLRSMAGAKTVSYRDFKVFRVVR